jgi:hypothetical protein
MDTVSTIKSLSWAKNWEVKYPLMSASLACRAYVSPMQKAFNTQVKNIIVVYKKGMCSCYLAEQDNQDFGKALAEQAMADLSLFKEMADNLMKETDNIQQLMKRPAAEFLDKKNIMELVDACNRFGTYQISTKALAEQLSPELFERYGKPLEKARLYCERVYPDLADFTIAILSIIAEKEGYTTEQLEALSDEELLAYIDTKNLPPRELLDKRHNTSAMFQSGNSRDYLTEEEVDDIEAEWKKQAESGIIKGQTAFPGKVTATVKIIKDFRKTDHFHDGDILVTHRHDRP